MTLSINIESHYADFCCAECFYAGCCYTKCHYADCHGATLKPNLRVHPNLIKLKRKNFDEANTLAYLSSDSVLNVAARVGIKALFATK